MPGGCAHAQPATAETAALPDERLQQASAAMAIGVGEFLDQKVQNFLTLDRWRIIVGLSPFPPLDAALAAHFVEQSHHGCVG